MGIMEGKKGLILGVFNKQSIAWAIADRVMREGGVCGFTYMPDKPDDHRQKNRGRLVELTEGNPRAAFLAPCNVTSDEDIAAAMKQAAGSFGKLDFLLHAIAFANPADLKAPTVATSREGFKLAMEISAYSLIAVTNAALPILNDKASILTLTYYGGEKAVPGYNVMGICKAALDCSVRYLAYDLGPRGIRVNAISAGPYRSVSGRGVGVDDMLLLYEAMSPLRRNITDDEVGSTGTFLLSPMSDGITGEILHLDCGYHIMGSPQPLVDKYATAKSG
jgi:enoyl-[acyl-carrier protein] reductase I